MCNNIRIEDELGDMSEFLEFDVEVLRTSTCL
jgi:hypothetical protein